jgi:phosphopantothenoylcysteine decarboxylase/phosphopantothenate--cysteine ligase
VLVGFKAEVGISEAELVRRAKVRMDEYRLDLMVANDLNNVAPARTKAVIITAAGGQTKFNGGKRELADRVLDEVLKVME